MVLAPFDYSQANGRLEGPELCHSKERSLLNSPVVSFEIVNRLLPLVLSDFLADSFIRSIWQEVFL